MYANPLMTNNFMPGQPAARPTANTTTAATPVRSSTPPGKSGLDSPTADVRLVDSSQPSSDVYIPVAARAAAPSTSIPLQIDDVKSFVLHPVPRGRMIKLKLVRHEERTIEWMYPRFELFLQEGPNLEYERFLLSARKRKKSKNANYLISISRDKENMLRHDDSYIGKVRGNFTGTEFQVGDGDYGIGFIMCISA